VTDRKRPPGIAALVILFAAGTLTAALAGFALLAFGGTADVTWNLGSSQAAALMFAVSAACGATGFGLWRGARWGHRAAVVLVAVSLVSDLLNATLGGEPRSWVGVPVAGLVLAVLLSPRMRAYFAGVGDGPGAPE
jgi:hypothetical protein